MEVSAPGWKAVGLVAIASVFLGCSAQEEKLYRVFGTVTHAGKPIPKGTISFDPTGDGPMGFASIEDGRFDTAQKGKGVRGGKYNVRVGGFTGVPGPDAPFGQALFPEYNGTAELPAEDANYDLDVPKGR